ncbi:MAG: MMPL family transporter [Thermoplasmata archaeon]|nr:MAG: MMPL family transporter [Thermoplasmata archaeon]
MEEQTTEKEEMKSSIPARVGSLAQRRSGSIILIVVIVTFLLFFPIMYMAPTERASDNPGGEVFNIRKEMETKLPPSVHQVPFIIEARDGDILTQKELWELYQNEEKLRQSEIGQDILITRYDVASGTMTFGVYSLADAVLSFFTMHPEFGVTLANATDDLVKLAIHFIFSDPSTSDLSQVLSTKATSENRTILGQQIVYWTSPAIYFPVNANNSKISLETTQGLTAGASGGPEHQKFNRDVQEILRGDEDTYRLWGVAIDITLEAEDEGMLSVPLVVAAIILILVIVTLHFKSLQVTLLTMVGLGMLIIWLKGLSNLIGLKSSLTLDILIPIAMLVLGVDYVIHSVHRYHEERASGADPGNALRLGIAGVGGALFLAMVTTVVAFLSNISSGIEDIIGFGIAAATAIISAMIIMGLFVPSVKMRWDARRSQKQAGRKRSEDETNSKSDTAEHRSGSVRLGRVVVSVAEKKAVILPVVVVITLVAGFYATNLESRLDAKDYFDSQSSFVISLDKLDEHYGETGGEPAYFFIRGDLSEPESLAAIRELINNVDDNENVARSIVDGKPSVDARIFDFLEAVLSSGVARSRIEASSPGLTITDDNNDSVPDSRPQLKAVYDYMVQYGIPLNETVLYYEPSQIWEALYHDPQGIDEDVTIVAVFIPGTREQAVVREAKLELTEDIKALDVDSISYYGLAGPAFERDITLAAVTDSLMSSIIIASFLCFIILLAAFKSLKYTIVTIIPVILVAIWLYAFMYVAGFYLNAVSATIAAISIGVGIDYSVHVTVRFRQELGKVSDKITALERTASQSGSALFGSAASTMIGFAIIAFAPMPMFSSFGILTALMILMAFIAALLVLPSMLMLVERK